MFSVALAWGWEVEVEGKKDCFSALGLTQTDQLSVSVTLTDLPLLLQR
jgi:hypothetical protein